MKVCGFTIVRNAVKFDYPVVEAIRSVLPLCDEFIVAVGDSDDGTRSMIEAMDVPEVRIADTTWDLSLREGGKLLSVETNKAMDALPDCSWAFYIQADEVLHENTLDRVHNAMLRWKDEPEVEGLLFDYLHFYGSYKYVGDARRWYRHEIRVIRPDSAIRSWGDAQGFRKSGRKLHVKRCGGVIHHYGWVKPPEKQQAKQESFHKMWHDDSWMKKHVPVQPAFDYNRVDALKPFDGTHPLVMNDRVKKEHWDFKWDPARQKRSWKERLLGGIEKLTGYRIGEYKNYHLSR